MKKNGITFGDFPLNKTGNNKRRNSLQEYYSLYDKHL